MMHHPSSAAQKTLPMTNQPPTDIAGGGEMGRRISQFDWAATPAGRITDWPVSLRTAVRLMLSSRLPMFVWWGRELTGYYNDAAIPLLGHRHPSALGRPAGDVWADKWDVIGPQAEEALDLGRATVTDRLPLTIERDGAPRGTAFTFSYSPAPDDAGVVAGVLVVCSEVVAPATSDAETLAALALAVAELGTWQLDPATGDVTADARCREIMGWDAAAAVTLDDSILRVHPDDWPRVDRAMTAALQPDGAGAFAEECRLMHRDGTVHWAAVRGQAVFDESTAPRTAVRLTGVIFDVTARKRAEAELREADRRKDVFLGTLAHELRNPLAPMRNSLQVLRMVDGPQHAAVQAREMMDRQLTHMVRLVDDLLDVSRISRGKLALRPDRARLQDVVRAAADASRPALEAAGVHLQMVLPPDPVWLSADAGRVAQIISNLLSNAAKFTGRHGHVKVTAEAHGAAAVVRVRDTGIGLSEKSLRTVFDLFSQADRSLEKTQGGLGIGLALARGLAELHGGTVSASSPGEGRGSEFTVRLPITADAAPADVPAPNPRRVLVVDDNVDAAASLEMLLKLFGCEAMTAHDGQEGVRLAGAHRPDIVMMDIGMPKLNGYEACRRIRREPWGTAIRIVAMTGWGTEDDRRQAAEAGFDRHFTKPVSPQDLKELLAAETADAGSAPG